MAKLTLHALVGQLQGKLGGLVIRKIRGRYYLSAKPEPRKKPTPGQKAFRLRFRIASDYAKHVQRTPALKAFYEPLARAIDLSAYHGRAGDPILVQASAKVGVASVGVRITGANGQLVEKGEAIFLKRRWRYT